VDLAYLSFSPSPSLGGSLLGEVKSADLFVSGEMSHHQVLAAQIKNTSVLLFEHSHTERGYLRKVLQPWLTKLLEEDGEGDDFAVIVSERDRDPLNTITY
jgi:putative NIF3 family GTP cyclohydrolase 1 type 2